MPRTSNKRTPSKLCIKCNKVKPLAEFFQHKQWASNLYRDAWCSKCAKEYVHDRESLQKYLFENNRKLTEAGWNAAQKKAQYSLQVNKKYIDVSTPEEERKAIEEEEICKAYLSIENTNYAYAYEENVRVNNANSDRENVTHEFSEEQDKPTYNEVWHGWFTPSEIRQLDAMYKSYEEDFVLDNISQIDYARKVIKASLNADMAEDRMRRGQGTFKEYMDAKQIFDDLSKSANFAACRRKPGESAGMGSLGEIILKLETQGYLDENPYTFPDDDIDKVIAAYRYTLTSIGMDIR